MNRPVWRILLLSILCLLLTALIAVQSAAQPTLGDHCSIDAVPAATLLFPYFEAQVLPAPTSANTTLSLLNADGAPHLVRVTLWTNWAVPTLAFDLFLGGADVENFMLSDLLNDLNWSAPSFPNQPNLRGCNVHGLSKPHFHPRLYPPGLRPATFDPYNGQHRSRLFTELRKAHLGQRTLRGWLWGAPVANQQGELAVGYVTVDVMNRCTSRFPNQAGYFADGGTGHAANDNVLLGDYFFYSPVFDTVEGEPAVHVRADAAIFQGRGTYTFYGRYVWTNAWDNRQPLGTKYATRYIESVPGFNWADTHLVVWRDTKSNLAQPIAGGMPAWAPLGGNELMIYDENEDRVTLSMEDRFQWATQKVDVGTWNLPYLFGWMEIDLDHRATGRFGDRAQAWVAPLFEAQNAASENMGACLRAFRLASPCP